MSNFEVKFSTKAPSKEFLKTFFGHARVETSDVFIESVIAYKPHPALTAWWATLNDKDTLIGTATLYLPPKSAGLMPPVFIGNFIIDVSHRRRGAGAYLLLALQNFCQQRNLRKLALEFTSDSSDFWKSQGFINTSQFPTLLFKEL